MRADFRNSAIARVSRFRDEEHREWRVVDAQCNRNGLVTAVFVPCTSANATHRFFIDDRRQEIRRYMFTPASAQELVFRTLLRQLHAALPVSWEPDVAESPASAPPNPRPFAETARVTAQQREKIPG